MKGYSEREVFENGHQIILHNATMLIGKLKDLPDKFQKEVRCHELTRAVAEIFMMEKEIRDGHYGRVEHSWLVLPNHEGRDTVILDTYCMGRLPQVQLVDMDGLASTFFRHRDLYEEGPRRTDINRGVIERLVHTMSRR